MARLPFLDQKDLAPEYREILARGLNVHRVMVHSPDAALARGGITDYFRTKIGIPPRLRELAILQVGWSERAPYEWAHHVEVAQKNGVTKQDIRDLIAESNGEKTGLDETTRTALRGVRELSKGPRMSAATFDALRDALGPRGAIDLLLVASHYVGLVRMLGTLEVDLEEAWQPHLDEFPLPG